MARLHHLALGVRDLVEVAGFYCRVLGLPEVGRQLDERGELRSVWLGLGASVLMLERTLEEPRRTSGVAAGPFLIAFQVAASERMALERKLEAAGSSIEARTEHSSYARDPEGNRIAISHYPLPSLELEPPADVGAEVSE
jgi:glyoxylase I family protein